MKNSFEKVKLDDFAFLINPYDRKIANLLCKFYNHGSPENFIIKEEALQIVSLFQAKQKLI